MAALTLNELFYERYIKNDFYLSAISYNDNGLYCVKDGNVVKMVRFNNHNDLSKLPVIAFKINDPLKFLEILEINNECDKSFDSAMEENDDLTKTIQIDRMYLPIRFILIKDISTEEEDKIVMNFLNTYNRLVNANGYLTTSSSAMFKQMSSVLNWVLDPAQNKPNNNAQTIVKQYIFSLNDGTNNNFIDSFNDTGKGLENDVPLVRTNPKAPSIIKNDFDMEKAGFFSFLSLLYVAINLLITLIILAIKK